MRCGADDAENTAELKKTLALFVPGLRKVFGGIDGAENVIDVKYIGSPCFFTAGDLIIALAAASYASNGSSAVNIMTRYVLTGNEADWVNNVAEADGNNWATQLVMQNREIQTGRFFTLSQYPVAIANGTRIYLFVVNYDLSKNQPNELKASSIPKCDLGIAVGEVTSTGVSQEAGKTIKWRALTSLGANVTSRLADELIYVLPELGSAYLTGDGGVVLVVKALKAKRLVSVHIRLTEKGNETEWDLLYIGATDTCSFSFVKWDEKIIMFPSLCYGISQGAKESVDMGKTWTDVVGPVAYQWNMLKYHRDFTPVTIDNKTVLFSTRSVKITIDGMNGYKLYLWMTDGKRAYKLKRIFSYYTRFVSSGLIHINGELFFLCYAPNNQWYTTLLITHKDWLKSADHILKAWNRTDEYLSRPCSDTAPRGASPNTLCLTPVPTDGLVGFLWNKTSRGVWHDEYLYLNATVRGVETVGRGLTFSGPGAGARWQIGTRRRAHWGDFARYGLTVLATVTIHDVQRSGGSSPLLTVGVAGGESSRLGLWYNKDNRWRAVLMNGNEIGSFGSWQMNREYRVVLTLWHNNAFSVHVDGDSVWAPPRIAGDDEKRPLVIEDVFLCGYVAGGGAGGVVGSVTVSSVLLYNRPLSAAEIEAFGKKK